MDKDKNTKFNKDLKNGIICFLIIMVVFTGVSKVMYNLTITNVKVQMVSAGNINKHVTGTAIIESTLDMPVYVKDGLYVNQVFVAKGDKVEKGDNLFQVDTSKIDKVISDKNMQLSKLELQIKDSQNEEAFSNESHDLQVRQANDNYNNACEKYDRDIAKALGEYEAAKQAYDDYMTNKSGATAATGTDADMVKVLTDTLNEKKSIYETLLETRDNDLLSLEQAVDSANLGMAKRTTVEQYQLDVKILNEEISELTKIKANNGMVKADIAGQIKDVKLTVGEATVSSAVITISKTDNTLLAKSEFAIKYKNDINVGDEIEIKCDDYKQTLTVDKVFEDTERNVMVVYSDIEQEDIVLGRQCEATLITHSTSYDTVVPLSALGKNANGKYCVYTYEVVNTITGSELKANEVEVLVLDKDDNNAAISADLISMGQQVIVESSRVITNESKVKIVE